MYYQNYEDYMRSVLGYPISNDIYTYDNAIYYYDENNRDCNVNQENIDEMYPNIYKKINPIVCRECDGFNEKITKEAVENIVEKIYSIIEQDNDISVININIENNRNSDKDIDSKYIQNKSIDNRSIQNNVRERLQNINRNGINEGNLRSTEIENRQRRPNNPLLRDLIRILVLNRLFRRPRPNRPPVRPPFPPSRPGGNYPMPPRPPMPRQEDYENYIR